MNHLTPLIRPENLQDWAGLDEAGRGCLAGPVVAAAVILDVNSPIPGLADSKKLSPARREELTGAIKRQALAWGLGLSWPEEIDRLNILQATFLAMSRALAALRGKYPAAPVPGLLIDGPHAVPGAVLTAAARAAGLTPGHALPQQAVIRGDDRIPAIAAASILAKTHRDRFMAALDRRFPGYGLAGHKGYATQAHYAAIDHLGPSAAHRLTFAGVAAPRQKKPHPTQQDGLAQQARAPQTDERPLLLTFIPGGA